MFGRMYDEEFQFFHELSTYGAYVLFAGLLVAGCTLLYAVYRGKRCSGNPWGAATLEWQCSSPPPHHNFDHVPVSGEPYVFEQMEYDEEVGGYVPLVISPPGEKIPEPTPEHV